LFLALILVVLFLEAICFSIEYIPFMGRADFTYVLQDDGHEIVEFFAASIFWFLAACYLLTEFGNAILTSFTRTSAFRITLLLVGSAFYGYSAASTATIDAADRFTESALVALRLLTAITIIFFVMGPKFMEVAGSVVAFAPYTEGSYKRLRGVHLILINRTFGDQEWVLHELEEIQKMGRPGLFTFELYITRKSESAEHSPLQRMSKKVRPDFFNIFKTLTEQRYAKEREEQLEGQEGLQQRLPVPVGVFFCGSPALGKAVHKGAAESMVDDLQQQITKHNANNT
jgi:hypothetical protein